MRVYSPQATKLRGRKKFGSLELPGSAHNIFITFFCLLFVAGGAYIFSVNKSSVQGYEMRTLEREIAELKKKNVELKVKEAEARSLSRVEEGGATLRMERVTESQVLDPENTIAIR